MSGSVTGLIAEDEPDQRNELRRLLARLWPDLRIVAECEDGLTALEACDAHSPQVAFLDIRLPGVSGLEVARRAGRSAHVVFVTAYDEFAVRAFDAGAVDYLLKPVEADRLTETIARLRDRLTRRPVDLDALLNTLSDRLPRREAIRWITAGSGDTVKMIAIDDVLSFRAEDKYTCVATPTERAWIRTSLKELSSRLDPDVFWRVHRNAIVRVSAILHARPDEDGGLNVWLRGAPEPVRVSDAFRHLFRSM